MLLFLSRLNFGIGIGATYSLVLFMGFFGTEPKRVSGKLLWIIGVPYFALLAFYLATPYVVSGLEYDASADVYREQYGPFLPIHASFHVF